jgi:hypothetical protein
MLLEFLIWPIPDILWRMTTIPFDAEADIADRLEKLC